MQLRGLESETSAGLVMDTPSPLLQRALSETPSWASDKIIGLDESWLREQQSFVSRHYWIAEGDINVFRVVGTRHPDYVGLSWLEFLEQGKRMSLNHGLWQTNPGYYTETARKEPEMSYISFNGQDWYVDGDGNHRTCIARFDFHWNRRTQLRGVGLTDLHFDDEFKTQFERARQRLVVRRIDSILRHESQLNRREDTAGWKLDHYVNTARLHPLPGGLSRRFGGELDTPALARLCTELEQPAWRRWWRAFSG